MCSEEEEGEDTTVKLTYCILFAQYIKDQLIAVLLASKDPVAITTSWLIYELTRRRDVFKKIEGEIRDTIGFEKYPDAESLKSLPTLKNAVKETLRLYHPCMTYTERSMEGICC